MDGDMGDSAVSGDAIQDQTEAHVRQREHGGVARIYGKYKLLPIGKPERIAARGDGLCLTPIGETRVHNLAVAD
jgi:hypothetical protein